MTFREKLLQERPEMVADVCFGGCCGCPEYYDYEPHCDCIPPLSGETVDERCTRCWDREMLDNGGAEA